MTHASLARLLSFSLLFIVLPVLTRGADDYQLQVVAYSQDYPSDPAAQLRTFWQPQLNENGQVLFGASWREVSGGRHVIYFGRPGALAPVLMSKQPAPGLFGYEFSGITPMVCNAEGELLASINLMLTPQPGMQTLGEVGSIWRGKPATLSLVGAGRSAAGGLPALKFANFTYAGGGQVYLAGARPYRISDNSTGYVVGNISLCPIIWRTTVSCGFATAPP
jgi:hypothetical protein